MSEYAIIEAPSILGLRPTGVENLPAALLAVGLANRLRARRAVRVEAPAHSPQRDRVTRRLNAGGIASRTGRRLQYSCLATCLRRP